MLERGEQARLALEILEVQQARIRVRRALSHLLDRTGPDHVLKAQVAAAIDHTHAANTERALDQVAALQDHPRLHRRRGGAACARRPGAECVGIPPIRPTTPTLGLRAYLLDQRHAFLPRENRAMIAEPIVPILSNEPSRIIIEP